MHRMQIARPGAWVWNDSGQRLEYSRGLCYTVRGNELYFRPLPVEFLYNRQESHAKPRSREVAKGFLGDLCARRELFGSGLSRLGSRK